MKSVQVAVDNFNVAAAAGFGFVVITDKRRYCFFAPTESNQRRWVDLLTKSLTQNKFTMEGFHQKCLQHFGRHYEIISSARGSIYEPEDVTGEKQNWKKVNKGTVILILLKNTISGSVEIRTIDKITIIEVARHKTITKEFKFVQRLGQFYTFGYPSDKRYLGFRFRKQQEIRPFVTSIHTLVQQLSSGTVQTTKEQEPIVRFLREQNLEQYAPIFLREEVDMSILPSLQAKDLERMGITAVGAKLKILNALKSCFAPNKSVGDNPENVDENRSHSFLSESSWLSPSVGRRRSRANGFLAISSANKIRESQSSLNLPKKSDPGYTDVSNLLTSTTVNTSPPEKKSLCREISFEELKLDSNPIGQGAFGVVYSGFWRGAKVAVKKLVVLDENVQKDFRREAELLHRLSNHPNIVGFVGVCSTPPDLCIITNFCIRGSLFDILVKKGQALPWKQITDFAIGIAAGVVHLHKENCIHRDLALRNILVDENWNVKITDFGLSRIKTHTIQTTTNNLGSVAWMAPEAILHKCYSEKSDVFSYGIVMWELVAQETPYVTEGLGNVQIAMGVTNNNLRPTIPPGQTCPVFFKELMEKCWAQNTADRPPMATVYSLLQRYKKLL
eukprot:TRINITY_DN8107_c0_g1_i2.p1 TRINITY_DN8107_c0_g1~~TRINITY_DN8107_c0_g1_i2.p1  ORF type:complete len:616 (+),score=81.93 TRINITY_DN8107_c0_g1_i2:135-1982(+)